MRHRMLIACGLSVLLLLNAAPAYAADDGDPVSGVPLLFGTASYGTDSFPGEQTSPNGQVGYNACGSTQGAAAYKVVVAVGTRIDLEVSETGGEPLCRVDLFRHTDGSAQLTNDDLYDSAARTPHLVATDPCAGTSCSITWTTPASDTYYIVFWPGGNNNPSQSEFDFTAAVLQRTSTVIGIAGHYAYSSPCYRVKRGSAFTVKGRVNPSSSTGTARFTIHKRDPQGTYDFVAAYNRTLSGARAQQSFNPSHGRYRVQILYLGNPSKLPSESVTRCVDVVAGSTVLQKMGNYSGTSADYVIYHGGREITVTAIVGPSPIGGSVRFRLEREYAENSYGYITSYTRPVSGGKAVLKFSIPYRSGLPFYRIRSEYRGDPWHFARTSAWRCIQINR